MNKLILVRGIPGSGKTTLAKKIHAETPNSVMVAADDFFETSDGYKFNPAFIKAAHAYCESMAMYHLFRKQTVIIHNTFVKNWEMSKYVDIATLLGIDLEIVEPSTSWKFDAEECFKRNTHGVPLETIQRMINSWESITLQKAH